MERLEHWLGTPFIWWRTPLTRPPERLSLAEPARRTVPYPISRTAGMTDFNT